jgi:hypothetical protein
MGSSTGINLVKGPFNNSHFWEYPNGPGIQWMNQVENLIGSGNGGNIWYANSAVSASGRGSSWPEAFKTITEAVAVAAAGDTILIKGTGFSESVTVNVAGLRIIGAGTGPREATWGQTSLVSSTADGWCLKITAAAVMVSNIKFVPPAYVSSGTPAAISFGAGSDYSIVQGCRFQGTTGSHKAIYFAANNSNSRISNCEFLYMNTATYGYGIYSNTNLVGACQIENCIFNSCLYDIQIVGRMCRLVGNVHSIVGLAANGTFPGTVTSKAVNLSGTNSGDNVMTQCTLGGTYNLATYTPASGDIWMGNYASIVATTAPNGLTVLVPAA